MSAALHPSLSADSLLLDVRPIFDGGTDPFGAIMQALGSLLPGQGLAVRAPFEPKPLFAVMASKGYAGRALRLAEGDWVAEFIPKAALQLDVRCLQPPEPMVQILAAAANLAPGQCLEVTHDRRPQLLYPRLEEAGYRHRSLEEPGGLIRIFILKPAVESKP